MSQKCQQKLTRLLSLVRLRQGWHDTFQALKRMQEWIVETECILAAEWGEPTEILTIAQVAKRFDCWSSDLAQLAQNPGGAVELSEPGHAVGANARARDDEGHGIA